MKHASCELVLFTTDKDSYEFFNEDKSDHNTITT